MSLRRISASLSRHPTGLDDEPPPRVSCSRHFLCRGAPDVRRRLWGDRASAGRGNAARRATSATRQRQIETKKTMPDRGSSAASGRARSPRITAAPSPQRKPAAYVHSAAARRFEGRRVASSFNGRFRGLEAHHCVRSVQTVLDVPGRRDSHVSVTPNATANHLSLASRASRQPSETTHVILCGKTSPFGSQLVANGP